MQCKRANTILNGTHFSILSIKQLHAQMLKKGIGKKLALHEKIISFCCNDPSGDMTYAQNLFDEIPERTVFISNTMIKGYSRINNPGHAVKVYINMLRESIKPDCYTYPFLLKGLDDELGFIYGRTLHCHVVKFGFECNEYVQNGLVRVYALSGQMDAARRIFEMSCKRDVLAWNVMISGYNRMKQYDESKKLFSEMEESQVSPSSVSMVLVLSAASKLKDLELGVRAHDRVRNCEIAPNLVLGNALLDMYASCGEMDIALEVFGSMKEWDVISWTAIVSGFVNIGQVDLARWYFDQMPERDLFSWTAMINGYLSINNYQEVLVLFREMQSLDVQPDEFVAVSALTACANLGTLEVGEWIKIYVERNKLRNDIYVANALIDMYFKCGSVEKARSAFHGMARKDKFTWTAMIVGLATNGYGEEALLMFSQMLRASIMPDEITYMGVLCACTHNGMVEKGRELFANMTSQHGIKPTMAHYGCMVDLLGRAGQLDEANKLIENMPMKANSVVWGALLNACRVHRNPQMAERAAENILELEPNNGALYVLLCDLYATCNMWDKLSALRKIMTGKEIKKPPGCSLIEVNGSIYEFVAGDWSHARSDEIYTMLEEVLKESKLLGYVPGYFNYVPQHWEDDKESIFPRWQEVIAFG